MRQFIIRWSINFLSEKIYPCSARQAYTHTCPVGYCMFFEFLVSLICNKLLLLLFYMIFKENIVANIQNIQLLVGYDDY